MEPADLGRVEVCGRRLLRPGEELLPVDDLQHALAAGAVGEIDAVAVGDRPMHAVGDGDWSGGARLLASEPEVADEHGLRRIAQVVDLRHAPRAPA